MSEPTTFSPGDVVRLKSGGPKMTAVDVYTNGHVRCVWVHDDGAAAVTFPSECLERVEEAPDAP